MKLERTAVFNIEGALHGMRNPKNSWDKSDTKVLNPSITLSDVLSKTAKTYPSEMQPEMESWFKKKWFEDLNVFIGYNDMKLAQMLIRAGTEHRKFLRQIMVTVDITAPLYVWKEFDTYKIGTVANSTSTMHKLSETPIKLDCFEIDDYYANLKCLQNIDHEFPQELSLDTGIENLIYFLENLRLKYLETNDIRYWKELIRWLPESWLQMRTVTMNYENLRNMYHQRKNHKLTEWRTICQWIESLPYAEFFITDKKSVLTN